jgi:hypothetical protein
MENGASTSDCRTFARRRPPRLRVRRSESAIGISFRLPTSDFRLPASGPSTSLSCPKAPRFFSRGLFESMGQNPNPFHRSELRRRREKDKTHVPQTRGAFPKKHAQNAGFFEMEKRMCPTRGRRRVVRSGVDIRPPTFALSNFHLCPRAPRFFHNADFGQQAKATLTHFTSATCDRSARPTKTPSVTFKSDTGQSRTPRLELPNRRRTDVVTEHAFGAVLPRKARRCGRSPQSQLFVFPQASRRASA